MNIHYSDEQSLSMQDGQKEAWFFVGATGITVTNTSNTAYRRGPGRTFSTWEEALFNYRSGFMQDAIRLAQSHFLAQAQERVLDRLHAPKYLDESLGECQYPSY